ncbi:MAG TPA: hypothetical protein DCO79_06660 [Spirochaeta sp.]|nr:hypothetical protein [Spirochaeta sp.]
MVQSVMREIILRLLQSAILLVILSSCTTAAYTEGSSEEEDEQAEGAVFESYIPDGWSVLSSVEADFNNDALIDIAAILEKSEDEDSLYPRTLIILFQNSMNSYTLSAATDTAVMRANEGGIWGDPFESLTVSGSDIVVEFYGGSNWRWYNKYNFTYRDNLWRLSELRLGYYFTPTTTFDNADEEYYNFLTGKYISRKTDDAGSLNIYEEDMKKRDLIPLKDFIINSAESTFYEDYL